MSGKTARKLRQLAKSQYGKDVAIEAGDNRAYKEVHVPANRDDGNEYRPAMTKIVKVDPKHPRAFYQHAKKMYKNGEAQKEAERIAKGYREDQKQAARKVAQDIDNILKDRQLPKPEMIIHKGEFATFDFTEQWAKWITDTGHELITALPITLLTREMTGDPEKDVHHLIFEFRGMQRQSLHMRLTSAGELYMDDNTVTDLSDVSARESVFIVDSVDKTKEEVFKEVSHFAWLRGGFTKPADREVDNAQ